MSEFLVFEELRNHVNPAGVTDKYHCISKFLRFQMEVEHRSVRVDYKF